MLGEGGGASNRAEGEGGLKKLFWRGALVGDRSQAFVKYVSAGKVEAGALFGGGSTAGFQVSIGGEGCLGGGSSRDRACNGGGGSCV